MNTTIEELRERIFPLARFVHEFSNLLGVPSFDKRTTLPGFRFGAPDYRHFILLRCARIVSTLNACVELMRGGFPQEIAVLMRTIIEYHTQIDFVIESLDEQRKLVGDAAAFVDDYFRDNQRPAPLGEKRFKLPQKRVHQKIGARLDAAPTAIGGRAASERYSNIYLTFSHYVHGRYPESTDLFGGSPGRFHLQGMRGTPKDRENAEIVDAFITTVSLCFIGLIQRLELWAFLSSDPMLRNWYDHNINRDEA